MSYSKGGDEEPSDPTGPTGPTGPAGPKEGDVCTIDNPIKFGIYKINSSGNCVMSVCKSGYRMNEAKNKCRCATCPNGYEADNIGEKCYEKCESVVSDEGETGWKKWTKIDEDDLNNCYKCNNGWTLTKNLVLPCHKSGSVPKNPPYKIPRRSLACPAP